MPIEPTFDPEVLRLRRPAGSRPISGAFFLLAALATAAAAGHNFTPGTGGYPVYGVIAVIIFFMCFPVGTVLIFRREGFDLDRRARVAIAWSSILGFRREDQHDLARLTEVRIVRYWLFNRVARAHDQHLHRVQLAGEDATSLELLSGLREDKANDVARRIADFLRLPIVRTRGRAEGIVAGP